MFPRIIRFVDSGVDPVAAESRDGRLSFGLDLMLGGITPRLGLP
jgi:hypothetical protein